MLSIFNLSIENRTWENLKPVGKCPGDGKGSFSFIYNDRLYVHGGGGGTRISWLDLSKKVFGGFQAHKVFNRVNELETQIPERRGDFGEKVSALEGS